KHEFDQKDSSLKVVPLGSDSFSSHLINNLGTSVFAENWNENRWSRSAALPSPRVWNSFGGTPLWGFRPTTFPPYARFTPFSPTYRLRRTCGRSPCSARSAPSGSEATILSSRTGRPVPAL